MGETNVVRFPCPKCGAVLKARRELAGRKARCSGCSERFNIPSFEEVHNRAEASGEVVQCKFCGFLDRGTFCSMCGFRLAPHPAPTIEALYLDDEVKRRAVEAFLADGGGDDWVAKYKRETGVARLSEQYERYNREVRRIDYAVRSADERAGSSAWDLAYRDVVRDLKRLPLSIPDNCPEKHALEIRIQEVSSDLERRGEEIQARDAAGRVEEAMKKGDPRAIEAALNDLADLAKSRPAHENLLKTMRDKAKGSRPPPA